MLKRIFILCLLLSVSVAQARMSVEPSLDVTTTIAEVTLNESGDELVSATIYANSDNRNFKLDGKRMREITDLINAKRNGWEVRLILQLSNNPETPTLYEITSVEIVSRENRLNSGILSTPSKAHSPIVAKNRRELNELFSAAYPYDSEYYDVNDNCFNRAHYWARTQQHLQEQRGEDRGTDKVFIFFSDAYIKRFKHKWWYHVAPVVYFQNQQKPWVFDSTFIDRPVSIEDWLGAFDQYTGGKCEKINSLEDFYANNHRPICMYIVAPMYNYIPTDLTRWGKLNNWRCRDFRQVMRIPAPGSLTSNPRARWSDPEFSYLTPKECL